MTTSTRKPPRRSARTSRSATARPVTASYLRNAALHYLSRRSGSAAMVRATLVRRAKRRQDVKALEPDIMTLIEGCLTELVGLGLIDDKRFAEGRAASLRAKGLSQRRIALGLKLKGIDAELAAVTQGDIDDLAQARRYAERKRLGPWRSSGGSDPTQRDKDLRSLARAGFSFEIAKQALKGEKI